MPQRYYFMANLANITVKNESDYCVVTTIIYSLKE